MKIIKNDNDIYDNNIVFIIKEIIKEYNTFINIILIIIILIYINNDDKNSYDDDDW